MTIAIRPTHRVGTVPWAAQQLHISLPLAYKLIHDGKLKSLKMGWARRITQTQLDECIALLEAEASADAAARRKA